VAWGRLNVFSRVVILDSDQGWPQLLAHGAVEAALGDYTFEFYGDGLDDHIFAAGDLRDGLSE
jgi:hypothetical protein